MSWRFQGAVTQKIILQGLERHAQRLATFWIKPALRAGRSLPLPQRPGRGAANPNSVPAGGTTAGQPDPSTPKEAAWMVDVVLWHLLCQ